MQICQATTCRTTTRLAKSLESENCCKYHNSCRLRPRRRLPWSRTILIKMILLMRLISTTKTSKSKRKSKWVLLLDCLAPQAMHLTSSRSRTTQRRLRASCLTKEPKKEENKEKVQTNCWVVARKTRTRTSAASKTWSSQTWNGKTSVRVGLVAKFKIEFHCRREK